MNAQVRVPPAADLAATVASAKVLMGVLTEATINTQLVIYMFSTFTRTMRIHTHKLTLQQRLRLAVSKMALLIILNLIFLVKS